MLSPATPPSPAEHHLLCVLLDSNLPTGGFVSSSGLESFAKHGFLSSSYAYSDSSSSSSHSHSVPSANSRGNGATSQGSGQGAGSRPAPATKKSVLGGVVEFARAEVRNYANTTGGFVRDAWESVAAARSRQTRQSGLEKGKGKALDEEGEEDVDMASRVQRAVDQIQMLDRYHEASLLSHVGRRSSKAQGVAMLTLFTRGLSRPVGLGAAEYDYVGEEEADGGDGRDIPEEDIGEKIVEAYKRLIRRGEAPGHLAICWGLMTSALGMSFDRTIHLHLFLHARSLLSSAVRLNLIGPYASSQLLLHPFRDIIEKEVERLEGAGGTTGLLRSEGRKTERQEGGEDGGQLPPVGPGGDFWDWTEEAERGPETTWPLGEVLMGRHDLQHSRIFNS
ncbi:hypothetical protein IAT38_004154 [Cryptococcus sp. DSM 104549]